MFVPLDPKLAATYLLVSLTLTLTPGPDTLFVIASGMRHRARGAVVSALGIGAGCVAHGLAAAVGLSALVASSPLAFDLIKDLGAAYLAWLGIKALRAALRPTSRGTMAADAPRASLAGVFRGALLTNLMNPKIPLFYLAILPQFVDASRGHVGLQTFLLSLIGNGVGVIYLAVVGIVSGHASERMTGRAFGRWLDGVAGAFFIGLALRLAVTGRPER